MPQPSDPLRQRICAATGADDAVPGPRIQELWSGYGEIRRFALTGTTVEGVVVKHVQTASSAPGKHPRGWNTDRSHQRKLRSYQVEAAFYNGFASRCGEARVAESWLADVEHTPWCFILEDLDAAGFPARHHQLHLDAPHSLLALAR